MIDYVGPNLFLASPPKCASRFLYRLLGRHPDIFTPQTKEIEWLENVLRRGVSPLLLEAQHFSNYQGQKYVFDDTPSGARADYSRALVACGDDTRFIFALRHPVERAFSEYWHQVINYTAQESFEDAFVRDSSIQNLSHMYAPIKRMLKHIGQEICLFLSFEKDIQALSEGEILNKIAAFLGLRTDVIKREQNVVVNAAAKAEFSLLNINDFLTRYENVVDVDQYKEIKKSYPDALIQYHGINRDVVRVFRAPSPALLEYKKKVESVFTHSLSEDVRDGIYERYFKNEYEDLAVLIGADALSFVS